MEHSKRLALGLALVLACPTVAQEEESHAYFSISTQRTFAPGETPTVQMWGTGFDALEFRLYRVNDPVTFFQKLEEDHRFGGEPAPRAGGQQQTALEKVRSWKQRWRGRMKNLMRAQFTRDSRQSYHAWSAERAAAANNSTYANLQTYADVPVLNSQQLVAKWEQKHESANRWDSSNVAIPVKEKGLYLLEATDGKIQAYTVVSVTDIAAITKAAPGKLVTRVVRRDTGAPVPNCPIIVLTGEKKDKRVEGKTDANGVYEVAANDEIAQNRVVLARSGAEFAAVSVDGNQFANRASDRLMAYIYTERPVYRPGHTVYYRAILRDKQDRGYQVPPPTEYNVEVQDSEGNPVHRERKTSSPMGTLSGEFKLPATAPLGYYNVQIRAGDNMQSGGFQVEEYKKPEYEVRVTTKTPRMIQGGKIEATIDARYFYGEPVAKAKVTYVVHKSRYWLPYYMDDADENEGGDGDSRYADKEQLLEEKGELDADGKLTIEVPTVEAENDLTYRIEGRVTDAAGREITGAGFVVATVGPYFLRASADKYVYSPGDTIKVGVESRDYANKAVSGVAFTAELSEYNWRGKQNNTAIASANGVTAGNGSGTAELKIPARGGSFHITVTSKTPGGRTVKDQEYVWVSGSGADWSGARQERIEIVADRKSYSPGDTAKMLVIAGKPNAHLWVTVEGKTLYKSYYVTAKDGTVNVDVPITSDFVPNIFVSAVMVHGNQLAQGSKSLKVPPDAFKMSIELTPSKPQFKPGEAGVYTLLAKDSAGKPVSGEFSVGVVDEAIYAVRPEGTPDIVNHFYGKQWTRVNTDSSLSYHFHGEAGKRRLQLASIRPFRPRAQLKPDRLVEPKVRKAFPDTAFWSATVRTDAAGRAEVKLNYPDALTTWRTTVRGISADSKVGNTINKVIVRKNLLIRLSTPRFFRQGDTMTVTAIAQNFLPDEKQVRISLETKGLTLVDGGTKDLAVPSRGTATVDYKVKVNNVAEAVLLGKALTDEESDALELTIPVIPFGVKMSQARGGAISVGKTSEESEITFPDGIEPTSRMLDLSASPSAAGALFEALEYLTSFPYGCTEQTMSSFLPNVIVSKTVQSLGLKTTINEAVLQKQIRAGLDRLYHFHHEDGGWGWWESDESDPFMTAYVVAGLAQAKTAGVKIEEERLTNAVKWLRESEKLAKAKPDLRAYAAYASAIAGAPNAELTNELYGQRASLSPYALAFVGLTLEAAKDKRAAEIATALEARAKLSDLEAWWEASQDYLMDVDVDSSPEATAYALKFLARQKPDSALLPKAALYLVNHRNQGYYWNSTKQTAMVIYGLTEFVGRSGELKPNFTATVYVNDKAVLTKRFTAGDALLPATLHLTADQLSAGRNKIRVTREGDGRLYWSARGGYYSQAAKLANRGGHQLEVAREYFKMTPNKTGDKIVYDLEPVQPAGVKQGDVIAVKLTVTGDDWRYLMVEDPIPAGAEMIERDDLYEFRAKPTWWEAWYTKRELRDDRAVFFQTWWSRGANRFTYLMKIVNPGDFRVSPSRVEPMYQPQYFAAGEASSLEVTR